MPARDTRSLPPRALQQASIEHGDNSQAGRLRHFSHVPRTSTSLSLSDLLHHDAPGWSGGAARCSRTAIQP
jgi:hypothetical protein